MNAAKKVARNQFEDEFIAHVISSASMQTLKSNTLASFRNIFKDEIQSEINSIFWHLEGSVKRNYLSNENWKLSGGGFYCFQLERIWRSYEKGCRSQCHLTTIQWINTSVYSRDIWQRKSALIKRTARLPHFFFRETKKFWKIRSFA